jgi:hypothetical protein
MACIACCTMAAVLHESSRGPAVGVVDCRINQPKLCAQSCNAIAQRLPKAPKQLTLHALNTCDCLKLVMALSAAALLLLVLLSLFMLQAADLS